ncbi:MAG: biotin transporter BioY [Longicatena sp.]
MLKTKDMTQCAFFTILFIIASKLVIPIGIIPITLQTMVVILAGVLLTPKHILLSYGLYFIMGLIGLPVFASGGGLSYVLQPSFGFLLSFPIAACFISIVRTKYHLSSFYKLFPICMFGLAIIYFIGCSYMYGIFNFYMGMQKNMGTIIALGAAPFIISDTFSIVLGCICGLRLQQITSINRALAH